MRPCSAIRIVALGVPVRCRIVCTSASMRQLITEGRDAATAVSDRQSRGNAERDCNTEWVPVDAPEHDKGHRSRRGRVIQQRST